MFRSIVFGLAVVAAMAWSGASASTAEARHCHGGGGYRHYPSYRTSYHRGGGHYSAPRRVVYVGGGHHGGHYGGGHYGGRHYGGHHGYHHGGHYGRSGVSFSFGF